MKVFRKLKNFQEMKTFRILQDFQKVVNLDKALLCLDLLSEVLETFQLPRSLGTTPAFIGDQRVEGKYGNGTLLRYTVNAAVAGTGEKLPIS